MEIVALKETKELIFHGVELTIHEVSFYGKEDGEAVEIVNRVEDAPRHFHILTLGNSLVVGKHYVLNITYTGILNDDLHGFYRSSYEDKGKKK